MEKKDGWVLHAMSKHFVDFVKDSRLMRLIAQRFFRSNCGSSKTWATGIPFIQFFQAGMRTVESDVTAKEKAERFDSLSWFANGYNPYTSSMVSADTSTFG